MIVALWMTAEPATLPPTAVVRAGQLAGIITESDVFQAFVEMSTASPGLHVTFELDDDEDVTATMTDLCRAHGAHLASVLSFVHTNRRTEATRRFGVVHIAAPAPDALLDAVWSSGHRVVAVVRDTVGAEARDRTSRGA